MNRCHHGLVPNQSGESNAHQGLRGSNGSNGSNESNDSWVARGDLDALTDRIDSLCFNDDWVGLVDLRDQCRSALERGKQLWPAAAYAEYRLALNGPPAFAASVVDSQAERFTFGPFAEVMSCAHTFAELDPFLSRGPGRGAVAHERIARGEDLRLLGSSPLSSAIALGDNDPFGLPLALLSFEPRYTEPTYEPSRLRSEAPVLDFAFKNVAITTSDPGLILTEAPEVTSALRDLASAWTTNSNGRVESLMVEGSAAHGVAALGCRSHRLQQITGAQALDWMAWTAASGGAEGRRRGMAAGRLGALWASLCLAGLNEETEMIAQHPLDELEVILGELRYYLFDDGAPPSGWALRLAIEDPLDGVAFVVNASDARLD